LLAIIISIAVGFIPALAIVAILCILVFALVQLGILQLYFGPANDGKGNQLVTGNWYDSGPAPAPPSIPVFKHIEKSEVFYVGGNEFTYDEAAAVCAAYDADLATYDQVNQAYNDGAEWCGYGWSQGGMALFPTQDSTWESLQQESDSSKRTGCGRPGVNGGYFDPQNKFGVNCFGVKPKGKHMKYPLPVPGTDSGNFNKMVDKFKGMISKFIVSPFNRDGWSAWSLNAHEVSLPSM
jgi:hypothetical protein